MNRVHILSGQKFACAMLKQGDGSWSSLLSPCSVSWWDLTLSEEKAGWLSFGGAGVSGSSAMVGIVS